MKITTSGKADETPDKSATTATLRAHGDTATVGAGTPPGDTSAGATVAGPGRRDGRAGRDGRAAARGRRGDEPRRARARHGSYVRSS